MESKNDELTLLDMRLDEVYLEHYGVKGMKWGVWNAATRAKYLGGKIASVGAKSAAVLGSSLSAVGRAAGNSASVLGERIKARIGAAKVKSAEKKEARKALAVQKKEEKAQAKIDAKNLKAQEKEERKAQRKELGMNPVTYHRLREKTLKSHDPAVIAKGMHTLTDAELNAKISRLEREAKIDKWAYAKSEQQQKAIQEKFKTITSNPVYQIGEGAAKAAASTLLQDTIVKKGLQPVLEQRVTYAANKSQNKFYDEHPGASRSSAAKTARDDMVKIAKAEYQTKLDNAQKISDAKYGEARVNMIVDEIKRNRRDSSGHINLPSNPEQDYIDMLKRNRRLSNGRINTAPVSTFK